jgi:hypothetical protein
MVRNLLFAPATEVRLMLASIPTSYAPQAAEPPPANARDLLHYFEYSSSGVEVIEDGLKEIPFGEYIVEQRRISRYQLFRAMQMQDRHPGVRIGECIAALGYLQIGEVERLYAEFMHLPIAQVA